MAAKLGHQRANSGHLPLGGGLVPARDRAEAEGEGGEMSRTESGAALLMRASSSQSQVFGALLEQAREFSGKLVGPNFHSLEIESEPQASDAKNSRNRTPHPNRGEKSWIDSSVEQGVNNKAPSSSRHRPPRPRLPVSSQASSACNSPRMNGSHTPPAPSSSSGSQPPRIAKISKSASTSSVPFSAGVNAAAVCQSLCSKSSDEQIWALKKLRFDLELCRCLADEEGGVAAVVKLIEPARSWWPQIGCTNLQTTAAAAAATIARVHSARRKICELGGIPALVQLLIKGTAEAQSHAARTLGLLAENRNFAYEIGQAGGCAPLVGMLTSATALHSSVISFQMSVDHDEAQAHAAVALAHLAALSSNQKKIVEAGGINPLVLSLSFGFPALQAAAARCLHSLALDAEYLELVVEAGALTTLTTLLAGEKVENSVQAAAAEALGAIIKDEHMAADAIPILVKMMCSGITEVEIAGTKALADMATKNKNNKTKIAEMPEAIPAIMQQLENAEIHQTLTRALEMQHKQRGDKALMDCLKQILDENWLLVLTKLAQEVGFALNNKTDAVALIKALKQSGNEQQLALARLLSTLSVRGYSQKKVMEAGDIGLNRLARLLKSESPSVKCKSAAALANLASLNPEVLRSKIDPRALISAAVHGESRVQALRCMFNLSNDENSVDWLIQAGALPVVLSGLTKTVSEVQRHAASIIANVAINPQIREQVVQGKGLERLLALLSKGDNKVKAAAAAALWQLSGESSDDTISETIGLLGGAKAAVSALQANVEEQRENVTGLIQSLAQSPDNAKRLAEEGAIGHLVMLLKSKSTEIQANAAEALRCIACISEGNCYLIVGPSASSVETMAQLLGSPSASVQRSIAGCIGALAPTRDLQEQIGHCGVIPLLVHLVEVGQFEAALEAAKALESLALNNKDNMLEFVQHEGPSAIHNLIEKLPAAVRNAKKAEKAPPLVIAPHTPRTDLESKRAQSESPNPAA